MKKQEETIKDEKEGDGDEERQRKNRKKRGKGRGRNALRKTQTRRNQTRCEKNHLDPGIQDVRRETEVRSALQGKKEV